MPSADVLALTGTAQTNRWNGPAPVGTGVVVTYSFPTTQSSYDTEARPGFSGFSATQQAYARQALETWGAVAGITFVEVPASVGGQIRFGLYDQSGLSNAVGNQLSGFAYTPNPATSSFQLGGDIFMNSVFYAGNDAAMSPGQRGYSILLHEIGHALGFKHPFEGTPTIDPTHDNSTYTVLSYNRPNTTTQLGTVDVEALQYYYGYTDPTYYWDAATYTLTRLGTAADDWLIGTDVADVFYGLEGTDVIYTGLGDDLLSGGAGNNSLYGGAGNDTASYAWSGSAVTVTLTTSAAQFSGVGTDVLSSIENVVGGWGADTLTGNSSANVLAGLGGADNLYGGSGGADTADYSRDASYGGTAAVSIYLGSNLAQDGFGTWDTLTSIVNAIGSDVASATYNDTVLGSSGDNWIDTRGGGDIVAAGNGNDTAYGGTGTDALYGGEGNDVLVGSGFYASYSGEIDYLLGEGGADYLFSGTAGIAYMDAGTGNDVLYGGTGGDYIVTGTGYDTVVLGGGVDLVILRAEELVAGEYDTFLDFTDAWDFIYMSASLAGSTFFVDGAGYSYMQTTVAGGSHLTVFTGITAAQVQDQVFFNL